MARAKRERCRVGGEEQRGEQVKGVGEDERTRTIKKEKKKRRKKW